ncbi:uncharacterized protein LOC141587507 [Silene latifolia]|uniref:uncharacterized protein LOC141587507 n=1 Tax=Silene latifolia TaxID=37657 RepID=UPI003D76DF76
MESILEEDYEEDWEEVSSKDKSPRLDSSSTSRVLDGFVKRVWPEAENVAFHSNGIFMEAIDVVPIWIEILWSPIKITGNALKKIANLVGTPLRCDSNTQLKTFLGYARIMVEVTVGEELPDVVEFQDELGNPHRQIVHYEWKPTICTECKAMGHLGRDCRKKQKVQPRNARCGYLRRVRRHAINKVHSGLGMNWSMLNNIDDHEGGRIWIVWDPMNYKVELVSSHAQVMHSRVTFLPTGVKWWLSVVYGFNRVAERAPLWDSLNLMAAVVSGPWLVMGDFNNVLAMDERIGSEITVAELKGFQECVATCGLMDAPAQGAFFTWNNKHDAGDMVFSRIDRVLINDEWLAQFSEADITFHPEGLYDHCPCTITLWPTCAKRKGSFKFFNMWGKDANFTQLLKISGRLG